MNKNIRKTLVWLLAVLLCVSTLGSLGLAEEVQNVVPTKVELNYDQPVSLALGKTLQLAVKLTPSNATTTLTWKSSNIKVARVDKNGLVTPVKLGRVTITVTTANKLKDTLVVNVVKTAVQPTKVTLNKSGTVELKKDATLALKATLRPSNATTTLTWVSSNSKIAAVNKNGLVKGIAAGIAKITVKTANGKTDSVNVKVTAGGGVQPTSVTLDRSGTASLRVGHTMHLRATVKPSNATTTLTWSSSSPKVASIDQDGHVQALAVGKTVLTVKTANGKTDKLNLNVVKGEIEPTKVFLNKTGTVTLRVGHTMHLRATLKPSNATTTLTWKSSNPKVASINQDGHVEAKRVGKAKFTVTTANGLKASVNLRVRKEIVDPTSVTVIPAAATLVVGEEFALIADIKPETAETTFTWVSANPDVVTVDEDGIVTARAAGQAVVTVTTANGLNAFSVITVTAQ